MWGCGVWGVGWDWRGVRCGVGVRGGVKCLNQATSAGSLDLRVGLESMCSNASVFSRNAGLMAYGGLLLWVCLGWCSRETKRKTTLLGCSPKRHRHHVKNATHVWAHVVHVKRGVPN